MDRRTFVKTAAVAAVSSLVPTALLASAPVAKPFRMMRQAMRPGAIFGHWEDVAWFDMVPGDLVMVEGFPKGEPDRLMQIEELPAFDEYGMESVLVTQSDPYRERGRPVGINAYAA